MPTDSDKSSIGERLTGEHDARDPDGLLTVDQAANPPSRTAYGHDETDTLDVEKVDEVETAQNAGAPAPAVAVPDQNGITAADTTGGR
ncbi:hypothetical protein [Subtercola sp. YIM 133946]|uniref:hypothetical protein n=1 Tax=Subtercola sp. YIM 133946 TaxID=3118909 RepID=UPI002F936283